ncbi:MAG: hypothetical protein M1821_009311 [Bathelium mastoideum]|nr:MAG: hypothetical protein M1821_009311 [Bathelium mastoideum]KAI9686932.1 MAG: hypothetical protein M1822_002685 [Bathelium mastoideum]
MLAALENTTFSEFLLMDKTYQSRIQLRRDLLAAHEQDTVACNPKANDAVFELYRWLTTIYLPHRFPHYFMLSRKNDKSGSLELKNTLTNEQITLRPSSPITALKTLGAHIDTDFLLLLPNTTTGKYHFEAFVTCFPSGFTTRSKLTLPLAAIHEPVPGYKDKIEKSMDRFFASLPAGRIVKRANWGITTTRKLFLLEGTHGHVGAESATPSDARAAAEITTKRDLEPGEEDDSDIDIGECVLRCERQTLHRLSETGALVFAFKTYQYELSDIKEEGNGEALAQAIDGLKAGNVPSMHVYKRGAVWGERVKEFLRA